MIIVAQKGTNSTFFVCSSIEEWDNLIVSNVKNCKETYVFDPHSYRGRYPNKVKFIKSTPTARRFMGVRLEGAFIFINSVYIEVSKRFIKNMLPFKRSYYLIRVDLQDFIKLVKNKELELCCRRNMWRIKQYK